MKVNIIFYQNLLAEISRKNSNNVTLLRIIALKNKLKNTYLYGNLPFLHNNKKNVHKMIFF